MELAFKQSLDNRIAISVESERGGWRAIIPTGTPSQGTPRSSAHEVTVAISPP
jgi:hypothetical protein